MKIISEAVHSWKKVTWKINLKYSNRNNLKKQRYASRSIHISASILCSRLITANIHVLNAWNE